MYTVIVTPTKHKIFTVAVSFKIGTVTVKILCSLLKNVLGIRTVSVKIYRLQAGLIHNWSNSKTVKAHKFKLVSIQNSIRGYAVFKQPFFAQARLNCSTARLVQW